MDKQTQIELEAAAFRRLVAHLDQNKAVQNIDLMNLAGFCRNCLACVFVRVRSHEFMCICVFAKNMYVT